MKYVYICSYCPQKYGNHLYRLNCCRVCVFNTDLSCNNQFENTARCPFLTHVIKCDDKLSFKLQSKHIKENISKALATAKNNVEL